MHLARIVIDPTRDTEIRRYACRSYVWPAGVTLGVTLERYAWLNSVTLALPVGAHLLGIVCVDSWLNHGFTVHRPQGRRVTRASIPDGGGMRRSANRPARIRCYQIPLWISFTSPLALGPVLFPGCDDLV